MDWRVAIVLAPVAIALSWALINIGAAAINQFRNFLSKQS